MASVKLTAGRIRDLQISAGKAQEFLRDTETPGLGVRVTVGAKAYIFQSKLKSGATIRTTIGDVRVWSLDDARVEARRLQTLIDQGIDPREQEREKVAAKAAAGAAKVIAKREAELKQRYTLRALCLAYVDYLKSKGKIKTARDTKSAFNVHIFAAWPDHAVSPACDITPNTIAAIIRKVRESGKERTAGILRNYLTAAYNAARRAPFDSAMSSSLIEFEITTNPAEIVPAIPVNRGDRTLSVDELRHYMKALGNDNAGQALWVSLRAGEQRMAQLLRAKVSDFNVDTGTLRLWDTKGKRTSAREHLLPMAPKAEAMIRALVEQRSGADEFIFCTSGRAVGQRVSKISKNMKGEPFDLRDIRRTCETMLAEIGIHKDTRSQLLSHGLSGVQATHYDRYDYINEKRAALVAWEKHLDGISSGKKSKKVVQLKRKTSN